MDINTYSKKNTRWVYILISTIIIYLWHGYQFGRNDQIEWLPYTLHMAISELYNSDLYIQFVANQWPNERWFMAKLFSLTIPNEAYFSFFLHFGALVLLCYSFFHLALRFVKSDLLVLFGFLFLIIPLSKIDLGSNEIYYNFMVSSVPAKAVGAYCILLTLRGKWIALSLALSLVTLLQTLVGIQLFVLLLGAGLLINLLEKRPLKKLFIGSGIYLALIGWWIISMLHATEDLGNISLYSLFSFRIPHHFIPSTFGIWNFVLTGIMFMFSIIWFKRKKWNFPLIFILLVLFGCLVYMLFVGVGQNELVLKTQWFKATIWIEFWFSIALFSFVHDIIKKFRISESFVSIILIGGLITVLILSILFRKPVYQFPFSSVEDSEVEIAKKVRESISDPDAIFIIPFANTTFKYWSRRGTYVDFKSVLHSPQYLNIWFPRIESLYGLNINSIRSTSEKAAQAKSHFLSLEDADFIKTNANYLLTYKTHRLNFDSVIENEDWVVYKIDAH